MPPTRQPNRWWIAVMGAWLQLFLGTVYAWSFFQQLLYDQFREIGWTQAGISRTFSLAICFLGIAAAWGGMKLPKYGPRKLAVAGGILFGIGYVLAAFALEWQSLTLLYLGYGVIGGIGLGLGYVTPVATVAKWFPDRKGLATGLVIMGFGFGALMMSKLIAPKLLAWSGNDLPTVFLWLGAIFFVAIMIGAVFLKNPPPDFMPSVAASKAKSDCQSALCPSEARILSRQFAAMWGIFFCNIVAGISIISFQSPLFQDIWRRIDSTLSAEKLAAYGATLIAVSAVFNGIGRMAWGAFSDRIGRLPSFRLMLGTQFLAFGLLVITGNPWAFGILICYVLLCYGGGFGTMPSFILDVFGPQKMAQAYGVILTAWSAGGIVGPEIVGQLKDRFGSAAASYAFFVGMGFLMCGMVLSLLLRHSPRKQA